MGPDIAWVALAATQFAAAFFDLSSGLAGAVIQKFVNCQLRVAIVGDIPAPSEALAAFIRESNRGEAVWFVASLDELEQRLTG